MVDPLRAFRHLFARFSPANPEGETGVAGRSREASAADTDSASGEDEQVRREPERGEVREFPQRTGEDREERAHPAHEHPGDGAASPRLVRSVRAYLDAQAEVALASLLEDLSRETMGEVGEALEKSRQALSREIGGVHEGIEASRRELSRIGRELVRSGASLESLQAAVSAVAPTLERLEGSLQDRQTQEFARERQLREEAERAALDDILATLDGLEAGMEQGSELVKALSEVQGRLDDTTVRRWWRAMGEATGVDRPLPEVPVADLGDWMKGLELTHRRLRDALARRGVSSIEAAWKPFDPHLHEAVAVEPSPPEQEGLVVREERRGYRTSDRVLRLAQVVVGRAAEEARE